MSAIETGFLYLGEGPDVGPANCGVRVPWPDKGPFSTVRMVDSARNALGEMVGRQVGRSLDKQELSWQCIESEAWWQLCRWLEAGHFTFYCRYFSHLLGTWQVRRFYLGDISCTPDAIDPKTGKPAFYRDAELSVIDCGETF